MRRGAAVRSMWKGAISFGLVSIPVKMYAATEEKDVAFHQVHSADGGRVKYKRVCSVDGAEVPYAEIAKGYDLPSGETVLVTEDDLADLPLSTSRNVEVLEFVPLAQIDPMYFSRSYYLEPEKVGLKPYLLLREALRQSGKVAVVKVALRQRESLAALRVRNDVFVLEVMLWPDEIREPDFAFLSEETPEIRPQELTMAASLIESLSDDFRPDAYQDGYREALEALIEAKIEGRDVIQTTGGPKAGAPVLDLMAALRASVEAAEKERAGKPDNADGAQNEGSVDRASGATSEQAGDETEEPTQKVTKTRRTA